MPSHKVRTGRWNELRMPWRGAVKSRLYLHVNIGDWGVALALRMFDRFLQTGSQGRTAAGYLYAQSSVAREDILTWRQRNVPLTPFHPAWLLVHNEVLHGEGLLHDPLSYLPDWPLLEPEIDEAVARLRRHCLNHGIQPSGVLVVLSLGGHADLAWQIVAKLEKAFPRAAFWFVLPLPTRDAGLIGWIRQMTWSLVEPRLEGRTCFFVDAGLPDAIDHTAAAFALFRAASADRGQPVLANAVADIERVSPRIGLRYASRDLRLKHSKRVAATDQELIMTMCDLAADLSSDTAKLVNYQSPPHDMPRYGVIGIPASRRQFARVKPMARKALAASELYRRSPGLHPLAIVRVNMAVEGKPCMAGTVWEPIPAPIASLTDMLNGHLRAPGGLGSEPPGRGNGGSQPIVTNVRVGRAYNFVSVEEHYH